jgi:hypothetical protein
VFQKNLDDGQVKPPNKKLFLKLLSEGKILLIIDAFDQIDNTINLQTAFYFINKLNKSLEGDAKVIITARTYSFRNSSEIDRIFVNQQTGTHFNEFFRHFKGGKRNSDFEIVYLKKFSGHPCGLPLKYSPGACVGEITENYFRADLDVYSGNSGSPVFCAETHELIGIVSRAQIPDFRWTGNSWITLRYPKTGAHYNGSQCSRASGFAKYISK